MSVHAGLAYGMPVRPDLLVQGLRRFRHALPTLHALRLCHRFGRGPQAHVFKLPVEIVLQIEQIIIKGTLERDDGPELAFRCYERRCDPIDHFLDEDLEEAMENARDALEHELYETCANETRTSAGHWNIVRCPKCGAAFQELMNEWAEHTHLVEELCEEQDVVWEQTISQRPEGAFAPFDKV